MNEAHSTDLDRCAALLRGIDIHGPVLAIASLAGGVSSDLFRVDLPGRSICAKFACARLRVDADWTAPLTRSRTEYDWLALAADRFPGSTPALYGYDDATHGFAMEFLPPDTHPMWKGRLLDGVIEPVMAANVGALLGAIHAATAGNQSIAARFATQEEFRSLRLDPYLGQAAARNPAVAPVLDALAAGLADARIALVHGDVSPKNILCGPEGPVLLDAECAVFGDPAFDVAFCLTHLVAKAIHAPARRGPLANTARALWGAYRDHILWEDLAEFERRVALLLLAIALARVDGKSPLEYLDMKQKQVLRAAAMTGLNRPLSGVDAVLAEMGC